MSVFLILAASSTVLPLSHSVARLDDAIALPHPNVLNFASSMPPVWTFTLSRLTTSIVRRATPSPSSSVLNRWRLNRIDEWASSELAPSAAITYEGSRVADVHAEPDDSAVSLLSPIRTDSPST